MLPRESAYPAGSRLQHRYCVRVQPTEALQATTSEGLAQGTYVCPARLGFEHATLQTQSTELTTETQGYNRDEFIWGFEPGNLPSKYAHDYITLQDHSKFIFHRTGCEQMGRTRWSDKWSTSTRSVVQGSCRSSPGQSTGAFPGCASRSSKTGSFAPTEAGRTCTRRGSVSWGSGRSHGRPSWNSPASNDCSRWRRPSRSLRRGHRHPLFRLPMPSLGWSSGPRAPLGSGVLGGLQTQW